MGIFIIEIVESGQNFTSAFLIGNQEKEWFSYDFLDNAFTITELFIFIFRLDLGVTLSFACIRGIVVLLISLWLSVLGMYFLCFFWILY